MALNYLLPVASKFVDFVKSISVGFRRRWKAGLGRALSVAGGIWLVTEIITKVSRTSEDWFRQHGDLYLACMVVACIACFFVYSYETRSVSFVVPTTHSRITIRFGDLLAEPTDWLIGVNEFFDSDVGHLVSQDSLHGKFIAKVFGGDGPKFRSALNSALAGTSPVPTERPVQPSLRYKIGNTAVIANGDHRAFLVALSQTNLVTAKASSSVPQLWDALTGALQSVHDYGNGAPLSMPLVGNGQSSLNVQPQHLLRLIALTLVDFGRKVGLPKQVNIILPEACFEVLDIREIQRDWSKT